MGTHYRIARLLVSACLWSCAGISARADSDVHAVPAARFLDSIGVNSAIAVRGENLQKTIECTRYLGIRWFRCGPESGVKYDDCIEIHRQTGARFSWGLGSGGTDLTKLLSTAKPLAAAGALLAFEGNNEPNNWGVTRQGEAGGGNKSWMPVAKLQRDLYAAVKSDPALKAYPVFSISEGGAETDNVGLQFLTIPPDAGTTMPAGTRYADFANVHNYVYHPNAPGLEDNKTWKASDPSPACRVDGLYGEYGLTWGRRYRGYSVAELEHLPRVTTETGCTIDGPVTEEIHALNLLSLYLDQLKRGWSYTAVYLLRDRVDEGGNQKFGFYKPDYTPRKAGIYLHNLTTILAEHLPQPPPSQGGGSTARRLPRSPPSQGGGSTAKRLPRSRPSQGGGSTARRLPRSRPLQGGGYAEPSPPTPSPRNRRGGYSDRGAAAKAARLAYSLSNQPDTVHDMLLEKADGTLELVVWGEMVKGSANVEVRLGATYTNVRVYDPTVGTEPIRTLTHAFAVPLTMTDHPFIIEIPRKK